jgi:hypothetical protein
MKHRHALRSNLQAVSSMADLNIPLEKRVKKLCNTTNEEE